MNFSALEIAALQDQRTWQALDLLNAHHELHEHVCIQQDDACTLSEEDAVEMLRLMRGFALVKETDSGLFACSLVPVHGSVDCVYARLQKAPNADGRYDAYSATDSFRSVFGFEV